MLFPRLLPSWARAARTVGTVGLVPLVTGAIVSVDPARFRLSTAPLVLHAISFRGPMAVGLTASGAATLLSTRLGWSAGGPPWRRLVAGVALLAAGLSHGATVVRRGWSAPADAARADLVMVSLNTLGGAATPPQIAALVAAELRTADTGAVSLPETSAELAAQTAALLADAGYPFQVFSTTERSDEFGTTSLLVDSRLGTYRQHPAPLMLLGAVLAKPVDGVGPTLAAVHPGAPTPHVGFGNWRRYVASAVGLSRDQPNSVVAGDFNATVDHAVMSDLAGGVNAAVAARRGAEGTWPARFPAALAAPIDHVLLHGAFRVLGTRTERVGGSDHRAVIARLGFGGGDGPG